MDSVTKLFTSILYRLTQALRTLYIFLSTPREPLRPFQASLHKSLNKTMALVFPLGLLGILLITEKPSPSFPLRISEVTLQDTLPDVYGSLSIKEIHGIHVSMGTDNTWYFEYETSHSQLLSVLSRTPFSIHASKASIACREIPTPLRNSIEAGIPLEGKKALSFFTEILPDGFTFYECLKPPLRHTLLLSRTSSRVLHKIVWVP